MRESDRLHFLRHVIEDDEGVGDHENTIRMSQVILRLLSDPFDEAHIVIRDVPNRSSPKSRKTGDLHRAVSPEKLPQGVERIVRLQNLRLSPFMNPHFAPFALEDDRGLASQKAVARPLLSALHALQEKRVGALLIFRKAETGVSISASTSR